MHSAPEGFYFQASNGSVALPVAGYDYNSDWTPLLADSHPLEWQLASLHQNPPLTGSARTCPVITSTISAIAASSAAITTHATLLRQRPRLTRPVSRPKLS